MFFTFLVLGIFMSPVVPTDSMAVQQAKAQLQFIEGQIEAKKSVEESSRKYARILEQIATTRDKAQQVLTAERIAKLLEAAQQARWNAAQSIIDEEQLRMMDVAGKERNRYGSLVSGRVTTTKRGR